MSIDKDKYIKKIDVNEEKGKIFVFLHHRKHNSPEFIREILQDKYILGDLHANLTTLYVFETPVKKKKKTTAKKSKPVASTEVATEPVESGEATAESTSTTARKTTTSRSRRRKTTK